ncbi:polymer-forming cytoskeletal protein [Marinomonas sp.]|nr:polymer-forming cytoskeletal protein [Marinomonas sp.]MDB4836920.1 polymer-forming cytoskeletal protein [Marinomonas sp.]
MGIFGGKNRGQSQPKTTTLIAEGCTVNGQIQVAHRLQIDGHVEGKVSEAKLVNISRTGFLIGELTASRLIINGTFEGTCRATYVEVLASGHITGTVYTDNLTIETGGKLNGNTISSKQEQEQEQHALAAKEAEKSTAELKTGIMDNLTLG